jgi:hypothetical protein
MDAMLTRARMLQMIEHIYVVRGFICDICAR